MIQILAWEVTIAVITRLAILIPCALTRQRTCKTFMPISVSSHVTLKRNRCSRPSDAWPLNASASCAITTKSSSITGVRRLAHVSSESVSMLIFLVTLEASAQGKPERSISPNAMNEEDRRELIARQHRALYGADSASFYGAPFSNDDNSTPRPQNQTAQSAPGQVPPGTRQSPLSYNAFGMASEHHPGMDNSNQYAHEQTAKGPSPKQPQQQQTRSRANSTSSPASNTQNYSVFENAAQQSSRTSTSSPGGSPPRPGNKNIGVAPIGTRPQQQAQAINPALQKRSTTPLPSPLSYGFAPGEGQGQNTMPATSLSNNERSTSAASNPTANNPKENMGLNWGSSSGVWGKNSLGVQASVWG